MGNNIAMQLLATYNIMNIHAHITNLKKQNYKTKWNFLIVLYMYPSLDPTPFSPLHTINPKLTYTLPIHYVYILLHTFISMNII